MQIAKPTDHMRIIQVPIRLLPHAHDFPLPRQATPGSAGLDLSAAVARTLTLEPFARVRVPCGFCMALPAHLEAQIRPRSGLAYKHGVTVLNAPGTIDSDYRGEVCALLVNLGQQVFSIHRGDRIAQMIVVSVQPLVWSPTKTLEPTKRQKSGFGASGIM